VKGAEVEGEEEGASRSKKGRRVSEEAAEGVVEGEEESEEKGEEVANTAGDGDDRGRGEVVSSEWRTREERPGDDSR